MSDYMRVVIDTKEVDRIAAQLDMRKEQILEQAAFKLQERAQLPPPTGAPRDTSALSNSIYTRTKKSDNFSTVTSKVKELAATKNRNPETEPLPQPSGNIVANVGPCVEYAAYVEFGTNRMAARPYLTPAAEWVGEYYNSGERWKELTL